jgi:hypothetical protein
MPVSPIFIELFLVLGVAFGWGIWELRSLAAIRKREGQEAIRQVPPERLPPPD